MTNEERDHKLDQKREDDLQELRIGQAVRKGIDKLIDDHQKMRDQMRELKAQSDRIEAQASRIEVQAILTNGRVKSVETWQAVKEGQIGILVLG